MTALAILLALAAPEARLVALRVEPLGDQTALSVVASSEPGRVGLSREGREVVLSLELALPDTLITPAGSPPIEALRLVQEPGGLSVRLQVAPEVPYSIRRDGPRVTVLFGAVAEEKPATTGTDVDSLYRGLFPPSAAPLAGPEGILPAGGEAGAPGEPADGLQLGNVTLRPTLISSYVNADTLPFDTPDPVRDTYFQIEPKVAAETVLLGGRLTADYAPRLRRGSELALVEQPSHFVNAAFELGEAPHALRIGEHYASGVLETYEVDPGGEYFFDLGAFRRNTVDGSLRLGRGGRLGLELGGGYTTVDVDDESSFYDYDTWWAQGGLGYEVTPMLRASLLYGYYRTPSPAEHPQAESTEQSITLGLDGEILPLLTGRFSVGWMDQESPAAGPGGTDFSGLTLSADLIKQFSPSTTLGINATRQTQLSSFEDNGFYLSNGIGVQLSAPLGLGITGSGAAGYHWNDYKTTASALGGPREDRIFGWSIGVGRPVTRRAYVRADYRHERRDSNLDDFDVTIDGFLLQVGIGFFGGGS
jgi:hypothetical protein